MSCPTDCSPLAFLTATLPSATLAEFCRKAMQCWSVQVSSLATTDPSAEASSPSSPQFMVVLPDSKDLLVTTSVAGKVTQRRMPAPIGELSEAWVAECLSLSTNPQWRPCVLDSRAIAGCVLARSSPDSIATADAWSSLWADLCVAVLPQIYREEADFLRRKLEAMAEFAAGAGHEVNNPAATIVGRAGQLLRDESDPERRRLLATIGAQAYRIRDMIGDAMLFARPPQPQREDVRIASVLTAAVEMLQSQIDAKALSVSRSVGDAVADRPLSADRTQLEIVFCELLRNAIEASERSGRIEIVVQQSSVLGETFVEITITDHGRGLSEIEREHLFDPFFSGRQAGRGLGFGLTKAWRIVQQHGGTLSVEIEPGLTRFKVRLPLEYSL